MRRLLPRESREIRESEVLQEAKGRFKGSKVDFEFSKELSEKLVKFGEECGASIHAILLAAWMVLLSRYAEEDIEDICVGTPFACRSTAESETCVGYFVTPLCIRALVTGRFRDFLGQVCRETQNALHFQAVPFAEICEELNLDMRQVLQAMFVFQSSPDFALQLPSFFMGHEGSEVPLGSELQLVSMALGQRYAQFDLAMMMAFSEGDDLRLIGNLQYTFGSYSRETILRLQSEYQRLLEQIVAEPFGANVAQIQFIHPGDLRLERRAISPWQACC